MLKEKEATQFHFTSYYFAISVLFKDKMKKKTQKLHFFLKSYFTLPSPPELSTFFPTEFSHHKIHQKKCDTDLKIVLYKQYRSIYIEALAVYRNDWF